MNALNIRSALVLGLTLALGLAVLGYQLAGAAIEVKQYDRSVTVKGLAERDVISDIVLWPVEFAAAGNQLEELYDLMEQHTGKIKAFLIKSGVAA